MLKRKKFAVEQNNVASLKNRHFYDEIKEMIEIFGNSGTGTVPVRGSSDTIVLVEDLLKKYLKSVIARAHYYEQYGLETPAEAAPFHDASATPVTPSGQVVTAATQLTPQPVSSYPPQYTGSAFVTPPTSAYGYNQPATLVPNGNPAPNVEYYANSNPDPAGNQQAYVASYLPEHAQDPAYAANAYPNGSAQQVQQYYNPASNVPINQTIVPDSGVASYPPSYYAQTPVNTGNPIHPNAGVHGERPYFATLPTPINYSSTQEQPAYTTPQHPQMYPGQSNIVNTFIVHSSSLGTVYPMYSSSSVSTPQPGLGQSNSINYTGEHPVQLMPNAYPHFFMASAASTPLASRIDQSYLYGNLNPNLATLSTEANPLFTAMSIPAKSEKLNLEYDIGEESVLYQVRHNKERLDRVLMIVNWLQTCDSDLDDMADIKDKLALIEGNSWGGFIGKMTTFISTYLDTKVKLEKDADTASKEQELDTKSIPDDSENATESQAKKKRSRPVKRRKKNNEDEESMLDENSKSAVEPMEEEDQDGKNSKTRRAIRKKKKDDHRKTEIEEEVKGEPDKEKDTGDIKVCKGPSEPDAKDDLSIQVFDGETGLSYKPYAPFSFAKDLDRFAQWIGVFRGARSNLPEVYSDQILCVSDSSLKLLAFLAWEGMLMITRTALKVKRSVEDSNSEAPLSRPEEFKDSSCILYCDHTRNTLGGILQASPIEAAPHKERPVWHAVYYAAHSYYYQITPRVDLLEPPHIREAWRRLNGLSFHHPSASFVSIQGPVREIQVKPRKTVSTAVVE